MRILFMGLCIVLLSALEGFALVQTDTVPSDVEFTPMESVPEDSVAVDNGAVAAGKDPFAEKIDSAVPPAPAEKRSLWAVFLLGLLGGAAALIMPCIFPMLPMTVSFFLKGGAGHIARAMIYGVSIVAIYCGLGLLVAVLFGADALNDLSTNGVFNFFFFLMLVAFGASFLGAFELQLPSSWGNKMDSKADRGGLLGIFFMAATLALVSFSCTGPIIGTLLVDAASGGELLAPIVGMFGFSLALAVPFTLFAIFPKWLSGLPKSGGWLNSVKVVLGLLELALALKFLSNVDLAYHWGLLDREVFLCLWIGVFLLMSLYLLGLVRFAHDSAVAALSVSRAMMFIVVFSFTMYLVPGLWGAPLRAVSAFLPPMASQDFDVSSSGGNPHEQAVGAGHNSGASGVKKKYAELFERPKGFDPFFDYQQGIDYAKKVGKPVLIDFTGHACVNCRKMEADVWTDREVARTINEEYVLIQLYVDDKTDLEPGEVFISAQGRRISTIGKKWSYLQAARFGANSQPYYVLLDPLTERPIVAPQGAEYDVAKYLAYLKSGL